MFRMPCLRSRILILFWGLLLHAVAFGQRIPVVVHIVSDNPDAVTDAEIVAAIADLNHAFAHTGPYAIGPGANTGIQFCLAQTDPDGGITNGITRTQSVLSDFDKDIEDKRMKDLINWDPSRYMNIWYVQGLKTEIFPEYRCGQWTRSTESGYATYPPRADHTDGVVVTRFGVLLAHETGHYLGLKHTFTKGGCPNGNCAVDGDGICDTPPSTVVSADCLTVINSCSSDTLSGLGIDQPDLIANFMTYSACANMFTNGQGVKMKSVLATERSGLLGGDRCNKPCNANILASFTRDNWFPVAGNTVTFTSTSIGGASQEWLVDGVVKGTGTTYSHNFPENGKYKITLKVYNPSKNCFSSYSHYVKVTCGVMARFYPDKRVIASKDPLLLDTILFTNRSVNAASYQWLMGNDTGMVETVVSTDTDLDYKFTNSGNYTVRLIATNGACSDTTETFSFKVIDPAMDGVIRFGGADCVDETKVRFSFSVCNNGYATIPIGVPISFYDTDPRKAGAVKLGSTFILPDPVLGNCCGQAYTVTLELGKRKVNSLFAVFNDAGLSIPISLPHTPFVEFRYDNNVSQLNGFRYRAAIVPAADTLIQGDTLQLVGRGLPSPTASFVWSDVPGLSCIDCPKPVFVADKNDVNLSLITTSRYNCTDTAYANIKVLIADDLTIKVRSAECYKTDSLLVNFEICNLYTKGRIPKGTQVSFYDADPAAGGREIGPGFVVPSTSSGNCAGYSHVIRGGHDFRLYVSVNDRGVAPFSMPNDTVLVERDYGNNTGSFDYAIETVVVNPADTSVLLKTSVDLAVVSTIYDPASVRWIPGPGYQLSCTNCATTSVIIKSESKVTVEMVNKYGCLIRGEAMVRPLPPDFRVEILGTECYTNTQTMVRFRICMDNGYDSLFTRIPVSFYESDPYAGGARRIDTTYYTPSRIAGSCAEFSTVMSTPRSGEIFAAVNDKGGGVFPDREYPESNDDNNVASAVAERFEVALSPGDTTVNRTSTISLRAATVAGSIGTYTWAPDDLLSCVNCLDPTIRVPYSMKIVFSARNQFGCTSVDTTDIKTFSAGPVNIPNAFTPNGDGKNDVFYIIGSRDIEIVKDFAIFNRFGQKVFQVRNVPPNDPAYGWRGIAGDGKVMSTSTFVYAVLVRFKDGTEQLYKGTITVIR